MFMFPEPSPIDYYITEVSPSCLSDGIFYQGNPAPCHKYVAKYLKPIKRTLSDPAPQIQQLDPRYLDRLLAKEKEGYVDPCGRDDGLVYETIRSMPERKRDHPTAQKSLSSIFPRSEQYELCYIKDRRLADAAKRAVIAVECPKNVQEEITNNKTDESPCHLMRAPFWWRDDTGEPKRLPIGHINDYAFRKLTESQDDERKISEKLEMDHPKKYIPGMIHRLKNPEDSNMQDTLDRADSFKVVLRSDEALPENSLPKDSPLLAKCTPSRKRPCAAVLHDSKQYQDAQATDKTTFDSDRRWQLLRHEIGYTGTDLERQEELRALTRPFLHDLHTWYSKNKPTKLMKLIR